MRKKELKEATGPSEGPRRADHRAPSSWADNKNAGLPRALSNMLDALQNEVLQLNVPRANTPIFVSLGHRNPLVGLSCHVSGNCLRMTAFTHPDKAVHDPRDLPGQLRTGYGPPWVLPVHRINL